MHDEAVLQSSRAQADKLMIYALAAHLAVTLGVAAMNATWGVALMVGVPALLVPFALYRLSPGSLPTRLAVACAFMVFSALLIQQTRGQIESHFGIFVLLAFLLYYRDWRPIVAAAALIAVHHLAFNYMQAAGMGVYVLIDGPSLPVILVHAAYVVAEAGMLIYMAVSLRRQAIESAHVAALAERIGAGDLSRTLSSDETKGLPLLAKVADMQDRLVETMANVRGSSDAVSLTAGELAANAHQVDDSMARQSEATTRIAATIGELTVSINQLSDRAAEAKHMAERSGEASNTGAAVVKSAVAEIQNIASAIGTLQNDMERLGSQFDSVANVVGLIKDIADQTNLLALNAAIEAARAGEQGRGFAVVADEVRKLAERTTQATEDISRTMQEMQGSKESALEGIASTVNKASRGVELASEAGRSIDSIGQGASGVQNMVSNIATTLSEQSQAAQDIARNIEAISAMTDTATTTANTTKSSAGKLSGISTTLADSIARFRIA